MCFFDTWKPERVTNPDASSTFQAGSSNHYTRARPPDINTLYCDFGHWKLVKVTHHFPRPSFFQTCFKHEDYLYIAQTINVHDEANCGGQTAVILTLKIGYGDLSLNLTLKWIWTVQGKKVYMKDYEMLPQYYKSCK